MVKFTYNNTKNTSSGHTLFELNYGYHPQMSYNEKFDLRSKSNSADELSAELRELIIVRQESPHHAQEIPKWANDKGFKPESYVLDDKV